MGVTQTLKYNRKFKQQLLGLKIYICIYITQVFSVYLNLQELQELWELQQLWESQELQELREFCHTEINTELYFWTDNELCDELQRLKDRRIFEEYRGDEYLTDYSPNLA